MCTNDGDVSSALSPETTHVIVAAGGSEVERSSTPAASWKVRATLVGRLFIALALYYWLSPVRCDMLLTIHLIVCEWFMPNVVDIRHYHVIRYHWAVCVGEEFPNGVWWKSILVVCGMKERGKSHDSHTHFEFNGLKASVGFYTPLLIDRLLCLFITRVWTGAAVKRKHHE